MLPNINIHHVEPCASDSRGLDLQRCTAKRSRNAVPYNQPDYAARTPLPPLCSKQLNRGCRVADIAPQTPHSKAIARPRSRRPATTVAQLPDQPHLSSSLHQSPSPLFRSAGTSWYPDPRAHTHTAYDHPRHDTLPSALEAGEDHSLSNTHSHSILACSRITGCLEHIDVAAGCIQQAAPDSSKYISQAAKAASQAQPRTTHAVASSHCGLQIRAQPMPPALAEQVSMLPDLVEETSTAVRLEAINRVMVEFIFPRLKLGDAEWKIIKCLHSGGPAQLQRFSNMYGWLQRAFKLDDMLQAKSIIEVIFNITL